MQRKFLPYSLLTLTFSLFVVTAIAQTQPDSGLLLRQLERERLGVLPDRAAPRSSEATTTSKQSSEATVYVTAFKFSGNSLLSNEKLTTSVAPYTRRSLNFAELQAAVAAVAEEYRSAGWVANAFLPEQDVFEGVISIHIDEAIYSGIVIEGQIKRVAAQRLIRGVEARQDVGKPLNLDAIDRAYLLASDIPGVAISWALRAGDRERETKLLYKVEDKDLIAGDVKVDNYGAIATGAERWSTNLYLNSPLGIGDQVFGSFNFSEGNRSLRLGYTIPVGYDGLKFGINTSRVSYELKGIDGSGSSVSDGLELRYPIVRARMKNLFVAVTADQKHFDNEFAGLTSTKYFVDVASLAISGNQFDDLLGGGSSSFEMAWINGRRRNQIGTTDSDFRKVQYSLSRQQSLTSNISLNVGLDGQISPDGLDTSESFYLGGPTGVRAYSLDEGRGTSGYVGKLELRWRYSEQYRVTGFYDYGRVHSSDDTPSMTLQGAGISLAWTPRSSIKLSLTLARRVSEDPNIRAAGSDHEGSQKENKLWLVASYSY